MRKKDVIALYREWRKENNNQKPNRVIVKMQWEDEEPGNTQVDTIAIVPFEKIGETEELPGDALILYYVSALKGLFALMKPNNGSDFVVDDVLEFYKM